MSKYFVFPTVKLNKNIVKYTYDLEILYLN